MRPEILLAGKDLVGLVRLATEIGHQTWNPTIIEAPNPVQALARRPYSAAGVCIVVLEGNENVADLYELFKSHPRTHFVLLVTAFPPDAALARVAQKHGSIFLSRNESGVVVAATVVSLLSQTGALAT